ncbi:MAG: hypothetical protein IT386_01460 [Deltaproteobacteria bacterium]|nr:hypothetical protein [Deltaproteobacteria bacterium]
MQKTVSYGAIHDWIALSVPGQAPHRFTGTSLGEDSEVGGDLSSTFAKVVGLAFMSEYAGACWFKVLRPLWDAVLATAQGNVEVSKVRPDDDGPDYLAAPFDPASAVQGGPFYAVEFKGKKAKVEFASETFKGWSRQAANISLRGQNAAVNLKSWVLAFNYGFERAGGSREESTLLVEDPEIAPDAPALEPDRVNGSSIIRDHLSRQCVVLGASILAPHVRLGRSLEGAKDLPPVYRIDHQRLKNRRYIGHWFSLTPQGDLIATPEAPSTQWRVIERGPRWLVVRGPEGIVEVAIHHDGPASWRGAQWLERLLWGRGAIFIGQDATMLRRCTQVATADALDGEPFQDELHFADAAGDGPYPSEVRVLRNGNVVATGATVELDESDFWLRAE